MPVVWVSRRVVARCARVSRPSTAFDRRSPSRPSSGTHNLAPFIHRTTLLFSLFPSFHPVFCLFFAERTQLVFCSTYSFQGASAFFRWVRSSKKHFYRDLSPPKPNCGSALPGATGLLAPSGGAESDETPPRQRIKVRGVSQLNLLCERSPDPAHLPTEGLPISPHLGHISNNHTHPTTLGPSRPPNTIDFR